MPVPAQLSPSPLTTSNPIFHPFPHLPFEIREQIWLNALHPLPEPRLIEVSVKSEGYGGRVLFDSHTHDPHKPMPDGYFPNRTNSARFFDIGAVTPPGCALLWTSREAREIAERFWAFCFSHIHPTTSLRKTMVLEPGILFQPTRDTIFIRGKHLYPGLKDTSSSELDMSKVRNLAIDSGQYQFDLMARRLFRGYNGEAPFIPSLDRLIIVVGDDRDRNPSETMMPEPRRRIPFQNVIMEGMRKKTGWEVLPDVGWVNRSGLLDDAPLTLPSPIMNEREIREVFNNAFGN